jgi:hypothetical protein
MRLNNAIAIGCLCLIWAACSNEHHQHHSQGNYNELEEKVMAVHDEVMPKMGQIKSLKKQLGAAKDSLARQNPANDSLIQVLQSRIEALEQADRAMWDWMHQYKVPTHEEDSVIMAYLEDEMKRVTEVRDKMLQSIEQGKTLSQSLRSAPAAPSPAP